MLFRFNPESSRIRLTRITIREPRKGTVGRPGGERNGSVGTADTKIWLHSCCFLSYDGEQQTYTAIQSHSDFSVPAFYQLNRNSLLPIESLASIFTQIMPRRSTVLRETHIYLPHERGPAIVAPMYGNMESLSYE
jgi:hypothetical protein